MPGNKEVPFQKFNPLPLVLWICSAVGIFITVLVGSDTGLTTLGGVVLILWLLIWLGIWFSQMLELRRRIEYGGLRSEAQGPVVIRAVCEPLLVIFLLLLIWSNVLLRVRLALCQDEMKTFAEQVIKGEISGEQTLEPRWIGLIHVSKVLSNSSGQVKFFTCPDGLLTVSGLLYAPKANVVEMGEEAVTAIQKPWYVWEQSW